MTATLTDPTLTDPTTAYPTTAVSAAALSNRDLETELLGLAGNLAAAQCRFLQLLAEFDHRGGWAGPGLKSCAHWLCWRIGMSLRTATEHVRVAHALTRLPRITAAFAAGRISYSKVRAITRVIGTPTADTPTADTPAADGAAASGLDPGGPEPGGPEPDGSEPDGSEPGGPESGGPVSGGPASGGPEPRRPDSGGHQPDQAAQPEIPALARDAEQVLLDLALAGTASHVEKIVRATRRARTDPNRTTALRSLSWHYDDEGALILRGRFTPDDGARLIATIDTLVGQRQPATHPAPPTPDGWQDTAREHAPGAADHRIAARRADALLALTTTGHTEPDTDTDTDTDTEDGDKDGAALETARHNACVIIHITADTGTARIDNGPEIPTTTAHRIACDADLQVLIHDTAHNRLYLSRRRRLATPAQITALTLRDGPGCTFPGCTHTRHLHAHHVHHWLHGGRTDPDNLALLCGFHHRLIHDHHYRIHWEHHWHFTRPDGTPVPPTGPPLHGTTDNLIELATRAQLRITRDTLTPHWNGERLDPHPILERLLPRVRTAA